jgi:hypothetical protein
LTATLIAILCTSLYLIRSNRQLFAKLATLSEQRSELAQKLISTQESTCVTFRANCTMSSDRC